MFFPKYKIVPLQGFCGGPLVNIEGEVIAVNIMKVAAGDGFGISLSIDAVSTSLEHLKKKGYDFHFEQLINYHHSVT